MNLCGGAGEQMPRAAFRQHMTDMSYSSQTSHGAHKYNNIIIFYTRTPKYFCIRYV